MDVWTLDMHDRHVDAREQQLVDMIAELREQVANLERQRLADHYDMTEARAEIRRHHEDFAKVSDLAGDLALMVATLTNSRPPTAEHVANIDTWVGRIRNIVG